MKKTCIASIVALGLLTWSYQSSLGAEELQTAHASRIIVHSKTNLPDGNSFLGFSPDNRRMVYGVWGPRDEYNRSETTVVVRDTTTLAVLRAVKCLKNAASEVSTAWSPDQKRLCVVEQPIGAKARLSFLELESGEVKSLEMLLPGDRHGRFIWLSESVLLMCNAAAINKYNDLYRKTVGVKSLDPEWVIDLDSLKVTPFKDLEQKLSKVIEFAEQTPACHPTARCQSSSDGKKSFMFIAQKDGSYRRLLIDDIQFPHFFHVSLDNSLIASDENFRLTLYRTGLRKQPELVASFRLDDLSDMSEEAKTSMQRTVENGKRVFARIYAPRYNPLNNKLIGANKEALKCVIQIQTIIGGVCTATIIEDFADSVLGKDVISGFQAEDKSVFAQEDAWTPLRTTAQSELPSSSAVAAAELSKLLVGSWRDQNSFATYNPDGTMSERMDNVNTAKSKWILSGNTLSLTIHEANGAPLSTPKTVRLTLLGLTDAYFVYEDRHMNVWRAIKDQSAKASKLLVGTWRYENCLITYYSDGTERVKYDNGQTAKLEWQISGDILTTKLVERNGKKLSDLFDDVEKRPVRYQILQLSNAKFVTKDERNKKEWYANRDQTSEEQRQAEERAIEDRRAKWAEASKLLAGTWRDENSLMVYSDDQSMNIKGDDGSTYKCKWSLDGGILSVTYIEKNGRTLGRPNTTKAQVLEITDSKFVFRDESLKVWHATKVK